MLSYQQTVKLIRDAGFAGHIEPSLEDGKVLISVPTSGCWSFPQTRKGVREFVELWRSGAQGHTIH